MKANWIGHILPSNCLLKHVIQGRLEGRIEVKGDEVEDVSCYWMAKGKDRTLETEGGRTRSQTTVQ